MSIAIVRGSGLGMLELKAHSETTPAFLIMVVRLAIRSHKRY